MISPACCRNSFPPSAASPSLSFVYIVLRIFSERERSVRNPYGRKRECNFSETTPQIYVGRLKHRERKNSHQGHSLRKVVVTAVAPLLLAVFVSPARKMTPIYLRRLARDSPDVRLPLDLGLGAPLHLAPQPREGQRVQPQRRVVRRLGIRSCEREEGEGDITLMP